MPPPPDSKTNNRCRLLELAAELRNRIYEHALVEDHTIAVHRNNIAQPGLLRTCRQIREKTRSMYYCRNNFKIETGAFDVRPVKKFFEQARGFWSNYDPDQHKKIDRLNDVEYGIRHCNPPWSRALEWLRAYHEDETPLYVCPHSSHHGGLCEDFAAAFDMVRAMAPFTWSGIEKVLEKYRQVANDEYGDEDWH